MGVPALVFNPRIMTQLRAAKVEQSQLVNVAKSPRVLRMFHLITPHALMKLEKDVPLLQKLEAHFSNNRALSPELSQALKGKGLIFNESGPKDNPYFYRVSGTSATEGKTIMDMYDSFIMDPIFEDVVICFEAVLGIELKSVVELNQNQLQKLNRLFDPKISAALGLLDSRGIKKVTITRPIRSDDWMISAEMEKETHQVVLFIPVSLLNGSLNNAYGMIYGALSP